MKRWWVWLFGRLGEEIHRKRLDELTLDFRSINIKVDVHRADHMDLKEDFRQVRNQITDLKRDVAKLELSVKYMDLIYKRRRRR